MSQIKRSGSVGFGDACITVTEEPKESVWGEWGKRFKRDVFARMIQQLNRIGWTVGPWDKADQYQAIALSHRSCRKGDLQGELRLSGRCIEFLMWQDVANVENSNGGRYDFDKEKRMPYLLWLEMERTRRRLRTYLCNIFEGYEFVDSHRDLRRGSVGPGRLTALEWVDLHNRSSGHYVEELGRARINMAVNAQSAEGGTIIHGMSVFSTDYKGRIVKGTAYYDLNSKWWIVTGRYDFLRKSAPDIYIHNPGDCRRKRNERERRRRLEGELSKAVKRMDFKRAEVLKNILLPPDERLFMVWHKQHGAYHRSNFCGYARDAGDAGKFTWEELGSFRPADGTMEDHLSRILPLEGEAAAA